MSRLLNKTAITVLTAIGIMFCQVGRADAEVKPVDQVLPPELSLYAGSESCIECHQKFYQPWSTSRHGLAMQPYTAEFARANLTPPKKDVAIGKYRYRADIGPQAGWVLETDLTLPWFLPY